MKNVKINTFIEEVSHEELENIVGAGRGWISTLTDDCPNSVIVCC